MKVMFVDRDSGVSLVIASQMVIKLPYHLRESKVNHAPAFALIHGILRRSFTPLTLTMAI